jgi:hypothetical protein
MSNVAVALVEVGDLKTNVVLAEGKDGLVHVSLVPTSDKPKEMGSE